jgi:hypothetical protein
MPLGRGQLLIAMLADHVLVIRNGPSNSSHRALGRGRAMHPFST